MTTLLVTGGCGFIGSNFIRYWLHHHPQDNIVNLDLLTYAGNLANLEDIADNSHYIFVNGDIADAALAAQTMEEYVPDIVVNFAAESHNSRAILHPEDFFRTNVLGTQTLLEAARQAKVSRFHHISTCEVFGDMPLDSTDKFLEESPYRPRTPYNASKAGADHAVRAYYETFNLPTTISICANNYGAYQFPEKLIPYFTVRLLQDQPMTLYKSSRHRREWLHVEDHCRALEAILQHGEIGETYNIGSETEMDIEEVAARLLSIFELDDSYKTYVPDRPGHDRRYLLDANKIHRKLGWEAKINLDDGFANTVQWYRDNESWWRPLLQKMEVVENKWK
ncbi:MAG: dTDP-glucose 4,6-dehydratase [Gammaproteobacteria bacterium WSBS_2016_MAG_OTU1]